MRLLTDYQDDALPMSERLEFERHVAVCPACRGYLSIASPRPPADEAALLAAFRTPEPDDR